MNKYNDAINICLMAIGERPIGESAPITGNYDAELASQVIDEARVEVLNTGYRFNTDENWEFAPDLDGYITIPTNALFVDASASNEDYIVKNTNLYNREDRTFIFEETVEADVRWDLDFDVIQRTAQNLIVAVAKKKLYERVVGVDNMLPYFIKEIEEFKTQLLADELEQSDYSIFDDNPAIRNRTRNP